MTNSKNMVLGVALGDAYGVGIEFQDRDWILHNVDFTKYVNKREGKQGINYESGFYSDDAEHTIGLMKALMSREPYSEELLLRYWKNEYDSDKLEKGFGRQGHGGIKDWYEGKLSVKELQDLQRNREDPGNAPTMRAVPLGYVNSSKINEYAIINANSTHPNQQAIDASILVARAAEYMLVKREDQNQIIKYCKNFVEEKHTLELLTRTDLIGNPEYLSEDEFEILCGPQPIPFLASQGKILKGLPCSSLKTAVSALYIIKHSKDAFTGLKQSINFGGDVDSLAAICTGILGGIYGLESLPSFMLEKLEGKSKLEKLAAEFDKYVETQ